MKISNSPFIVVLTVLWAVGVISAHGQASRTWVSGVGDDQNPCSRVAPCKTFAGAISKTAVNGEINCLDPAGFGAVTITKSMTIDGEGTLASIINAGTHAVIINAGTNDVVTLRNLSFNGFASGLNAVRVLQAGVVRVENCVMFGGVTNCIDFQPSNGNAVMHVLNSEIYNFGGAGIFVNPSTTGKVFVEGTKINNCLMGINADGGIVTISDMTITDNRSYGLFTSGGGSIRTLRNNAIFGNNPDGSATGSVPLR